MKPNRNRLTVFVFISLLPLVLPVSGCPEEEDDDDASGGMCFYACTGEGGGSSSGCWWYETKEECEEDVEDSCASNGFTVEELEYVEGCSMCDECAPDWYDI